MNGPSFGRKLRARVEEKQRMSRGFSVEIRIFDHRGGKVFEWRRGQNNLVLGLIETTRFVTMKLGIDYLHFLPHTQIHYQNNQREQDIHTASPQTTSGSVTADPILQD